jgi:ubiquinone/menaquinone biosynthesis C-methylase UbiE
MPAIDDEVARHYTRGSLLDMIRGGLQQMGRKPERIDPDDLAGVDEFHMGARRASEELATALSPTSDQHVLDIGSGIGGPARYLVSRFGCRVTGIDLTPEFVAIADELTRMTGLADRAGFQVGSAAALPFADHSFDAATMLHVGMNIPDKEAAFAEAARVVRPGSLFIVYDAMRLAPGELAYPMPWARSAETSFVAEPADYRRWLEAAGFAIVGEEDRRELALDMFAQMRARLDSGEPPPPLSLLTLIGPDAPRMFGNLAQAVGAGAVAPVRILARRR